MNEPKAGQLNRRITIRQWQDMPAMGGGITQNFTALATVWAKIEPVGTGIFFGSQQIESGVTHRIIIRRSAAINELTVTANHVADYGNQRFRIKRVSDMNDARRWLLLEVEQLHA